MKNISLTKEDNSNDFLHSLVKSLKVKFLHPMRRSRRMLLFKMRNFKELKNAIMRIFPVASIRSSRPEFFYKKVFLNNFEKFTGKHVCRSLFLIRCKLNFITNRLRHTCFSVNFATF